MSTDVRTEPGVPALFRIAVIGAGPRGRAFARRCAEVGFEVTLEDVLCSNLRRAEEQMDDAPAASRERLHLAGTVEDAVREADLAIDFVPDELESKLEIFTLLDRMAPPKTILCTPTELDVTDLASCTYRSDRCVGLASTSNEFEDGVVLKRGRATSEETMTAVRECFLRLSLPVQILSDEGVR